jgi:hypothetical protein
VACCTDVRKSLGGYAHFIDTIFRFDRTIREEQSMKIYPSGEQTTDGYHPRKPWLRKKVIVPLTTLLVLILVSFAPFMGHQQAKAASWNLVWGDDFNSVNSGAISRLNTADWLYDTGTSYPGGAPNWGTGEVETNTSSTNNVYLDGNGHLAIRPVRDSNGNWTSGRIETQRSDFAAPAGGVMAVEASIQVPNVTGYAAQGYWPAFWLLGSSFRGNYNNWPGVGEIDAMENVNGDDVEHGTLHCGVTPGGPCDEKIGLGGAANCPSTTCQTGFHTYRIEVDRSTTPEEVRWYLDGTEFWHVDSDTSGMDATTWANTVDHSFFIILNVAMGGNWPGNPTAATQSAPMLISYVHVYTIGGPPPTTPTPSPSTTPTIPTPTPTIPTPTPTIPTPTPIPSSGCTAGSITEGVTSTGSSSAQPWFTSCSWTAGYVILHYTLPGFVQQNVYMPCDSSTGNWEYSVSGMSPGQTLQYWFTYQKNGLQYDTSTYTWTHP